MAIPQKFKILKIKKLSVTNFKLRYSQHSKVVTNKSHKMKEVFKNISIEQHLKQKKEKKCVRLFAVK